MTGEGAAGPPRRPEAAPSEPRRRPRYPGTHPRTFAEKYKERDPGKYPETLRKVLESGKTPAGSHVPILVQEVLEVLAPKPGEIAVDGTLGYGGHATELLPRLLPGGRLYGLDVDGVELAKTAARLPDVRCVRMSFAGLPKLLGKEELDGVDIVLLDLGVSSMQLDDPSRGFTFKREGPLDLRMNRLRGLPASAWLDRLSEAELARALVEGADEPQADVLAKALVAGRPFATTTALANAVRAALPPRVRERDGDDTVQRTFQALRILVNEELTALDMLLRALPSCLRPGGRVAILSFHSGEDRRVKKAFQAGERDGTYGRVAADVIRAGPEERLRNPRARSAKLRWAVRAIDDGEAATYRPPPVEISSRGRE